MPVLSTNSSKRTSFLSFNWLEKGRHYTSRHRRAAPDLPRGKARLQRFKWNSVSMRDTRRPMSGLERLPKVRRAPPYSTKSSPKINQELLYKMGSGHFQLTPFCTKRAETTAKPLKKFCPILGNAPKNFVPKCPKTPQGIRELAPRGFPN